MKFTGLIVLLSTLILVFSASSASASQKAKTKKHHAAHSMKHKSSKHRKVAQVKARPATERKVASAETPSRASAYPSSRQGAGYVSKYFQKSAYANTASEK